jgi:hypothetical protein
MAAAAGDGNRHWLALCSGQARDTVGRESLWKRPIREPVGEMRLTQVNPQRRGAIRLTCKEYEFE